jgi:hypothetical protein
MIDHTDIKVLLLNASTLVISFAQVEMALKIALLLISIGYTAQKWYLMYKENKDGQN